MPESEYLLLSGEDFRRHANGHFDFPRAGFTRKVCMSTLYISGFVGIFSLALEAGFFHEAQKDTGGWIPIRMPTAVKDILLLLINIFVTALTENTGFVHTTALR